MLSFQLVPRTLKLTALMRVFVVRTKKSMRSIGIRFSIRNLKSMSIPIETKKMATKIVLKECKLSCIHFVPFMLLTMIPAMNAPNASDRPKTALSAAKPKQIMSAVNAWSSWSRPSFFVMKGRLIGFFFLKAKKRSVMKMIAPSICTIGLIVFPPPTSVIIIIIGTMAKSCARSMARAFLPLVVLSSFRDSKSLRSTAVLLRLMTNPRRSMRPSGQSKSVPIRSIAPTLKTICPSVPKSATRQLLMRSTTDISIPMKKRRSMIPKFPIVWVMVGDCMSPRACGPMSMPAMM